MNIVIYHDHCPDGFLSACIARQKLGMANTLYRPMSYGQPPPDVNGYNVYILDFSFPRHVMLDIAERANSVVVLDHHVSALKECENIPGVEFIFDIKKSGCRLTWEYFFPNIPLPWLAAYVEDRDLWRWTLKESKAVNAALSSYPFDFDVWGNFSSLDALTVEGKAILRYQSTQVDKICRNAFEMPVGGYNVLVANTPILQSEVAGRLAEDRPFGAVCFIRADGKAQWSLRSTENGVDVSTIAAGYGGGGHKHAAGFETPNVSVLAP